MPAGLHAQRPALLARRHLPHYSDDRLLRRVPVDGRLPPQRRAIHLRLR